MTYAALIVVCIVGAVLQSSIGFGFPIFAMIFISMLFPFQTATTITQAAGILGVGYFFFRYIRQVRWRVLAPFILSAIPVGMLCTLVSDKLDVSLLKIYLGVVLVLIALFFASVLGIGFGIMIGWNRTLKATLGSLFELIRPIPPIAWIPLITIWFGISELPKVLIIFIGTFPIIVTNTYTGVAMTDPLTLQVGKVFRASKLRLLTDFVLPSGLPAIFSGIRMAIGVGWAIVLAAEMVGATSGVGFLIYRGNELRDMALIFVCMFIIGIIGALLSAGASYIEKRLCAWNS